MPAEEWIRNVGQSRPALVISQEPGAAAQGNPALVINQADATGTGLVVRSAGALFDLQTPAGLSKFKIDSSGSMTAGGPITGNMLLTQPLMTAVAATMDRSRAVAASSALTSGTVYLTGLVLPGGIPTAKCTMFTNTTVKTGGTHGWYVLTDASLKVVAVTADQTDAATVWGTASTGYPLSWTASYTPPVTALHYVGIMVAMSAGTTPTITVATATAAGIAGAAGITNGVTLVGSSSTSQTTPPALGATLTALSPVSGALFYAYLE